MTWVASASLAPVLVYGVLLFGLPALLVVAVALGTALAAELAATLPWRRFTLGDGSAFLTGLLLGLFLPAGAPLYVPAAASAFGILVVKQSFGGLGRNWMNPAMGGLLFVLVSWPGPSSQWIAPLGGPSAGPILPPLEALRAALAGAGAHGPTPLAVLANAGYAFSNLDGAVIGWINAHLLSPIGAPLRPGTFDVLVGHVAGGVGAGAAVVMIGVSWLLYRRIVGWQLPVLYLGTFAVLSLVFGGLGSGQGWFAGGPGFHLLSGSIVLAAFYAAPDPVTSPLTNAGRCTLGVVLGILTFFMRFFGSLGDGVAASVVLGNCVAPLLDQWTSRRGPARSRSEAA